MSEEIKNEQNTEELVEQSRPIVLEEAIESILFAAGHPISYATLARALNITPSKARDAVLDYSLKYNNSELARGVILLTYSDSCQLCTKQYYLPEIREALGIKKSGTLSTAAMETLAIVAYNQPVTRIFVDTLRKVDSSYAMNSLIDRGLIECKGRLDVPGRPMLYGTTSDFLRCFGLADLDSLPKTTEEMTEVFAKAKEETAPSSDETDSVSNGEQMEILDAEATKSDTDAVESTEDTDASVENVEIELEEPSAEDDVIADFN